MSDSDQTQETVRKCLKKAYIEASENKEYPKCMDEWEVTNIYKGNAKCPCGKTNICYITELTNQINGDEVTIGSTCILKTLDDHQIFREANEMYVEFKKEADKEKRRRKKEQEIATIEDNIKAKIKTQQTFEMYANDYPYETKINNLYTIQLKKLKNKDYYDLLIKQLNKYTKNPLPIYKSKTNSYYLKMYLSKPSYIRKNLNTFKVKFINKNGYINAKLVEDIQKPLAEIVIN